MNTLLILFLEFFKTGLFAVGGGLATIPFLTEMTVKYPGWFQNVKLTDMIAIAESTPGPIGINAATYCGFSAAGIPGALVATFSLILPSVIIITIIARAYNKYRQSKIVNDMFNALHPAVTGLIAAACLTVLFSALKITSFADFRSVDLRCALLFVVMIVLTQIKKISKLHPIVFILAGAVIGIIIPL